MKKFENIALFSDIDGTLTNGEGGISKENLDAIEYFTSNGGRFIISSGRHYDYSEKTLGYKPNFPIIALNGSHIYDVESGKDLWTKSLDDGAKNVALELFEIAEGERFVTAVNYRDETVICRNKDELKKALFGEKEAFKAVFVGENELTSKLYDYANENFEGLARVVKSAEILTEVLPIGSGKHLCVKKVCEYFADDPTVVAVGDYTNDIEMIRDADIGYAVENALPEVKAVADRFAPKNTHHAIAYIIKELENL